MPGKLINIVLLLVVFCIAFGAVEIILRQLDYRPWQIKTYVNEPSTHQHDAELGWINKAGKYHYAPYVEGEAEIHMTYLQHGLRRTSARQGHVRDERDKIVFVGGSFTQGWAISDHETYPWKVQNAVPEYEVLNFGTGGYGTYQSLLALERNLPALGKTKLVFYGFFMHHEERNIAPGHWLALLASLKNRSHVAVPYVAIGESGQLVRHEPEAFLERPLPFRDKLASVHLLEKAWVKVRTRGRLAQKQEVTEKLLLQMNEFVAGHDARLVVVFLWMPDSMKKHFKGVLAKSGIIAIDCVHPLDETMKVKVDGHPNGAMNSKWASCILENMTRHHLLH